ncbi:MAG: response regulator transcription factor [Blastomonas sp.]|nr:response regulator transcription factor [Blastomonas sp.]
MRILLVEDELQLAEALCDALRRERFNVDHTDSLATALEAAALAPFDLVLLDRTLPDGDGLSLIKELRAHNPGVAVIVLSARGEVADRVLGLDHGADDYLIKPFSLDEMLARIRAIRRRPSDLVDEEIRVGSLVFNLSNDEARVGGVRVALTRRELRVLATLMKRSRRTVLRESLEQAVFNFDDEVHSNTLDSHVSRLRKKLGRVGAGVEIHPIRGVGYMLSEML